MTPEIQWVPIFTVSNEIRRAFTARGIEEKCIKILAGNLKEEANFEVIGLGWRIILK
jgi:hypothetical protein